MADKYEPPQYPPPAQYPNHSQTGFQSPPPQMAYDPNYQQQYDASRGMNQGYYGGPPPPQGYYGGPGYGPPPPGWNGQPQPVIYQRDRSGDGPGICTGILAGLACCCCLEALF
ncbi:hypothetical protein AYL99_02405 [Fonsecaea erecta]|uniref:Uncharacterized protein n=1 Tax=Fonsecaea erecta TaxID=1367422 RepID=A0A178ZTS5_9EURO|nr:hypothetical protein AYL99_02405 [Fonsecaea erecta]OAP63178.1 hypothetical protein AYL99_02405 [Fonsecaea erecta]